MGRIYEQAVVKELKKGTCVINIMNDPLSSFGVNDADYAIIVPKIAKIDHAIDYYGSVGMRHPPPPGWKPGGTDHVVIVPPWRSRNLTPVIYAQKDLEEILHDPNAPADVIAAKLQAYRAARAKALADLRIAQAELRAILTVRQEAVMAMHDLLDGDI